MRSWSHCKLVMERVWVGCDLYGEDEMVRPFCLSLGRRPQSWTHRMLRPVMQLLSW